MPRGPGHGQGVDPGVNEEALVFEADENAREARRNALTRREAPLAVGGRPRSEEPALRAEEDRGDRVLEADDRDRQPKKRNKKEGPSGNEESAALQEGKAHCTISTHCPFVLAWSPASYIASTATPG